MTKAKILVLICSDDLFLIEDNCNECTCKIFILLYDSIYVSQIGSEHLSIGWWFSYYSGEQSVPPAGCGRLLLLIFTLQALKCYPDRRQQLITGVHVK